MGSISSMQYAIKKSKYGWKKDTAENILKFRLRYGDKSLEYQNIKDTFYCYGCYLQWKEVNNNEPTEYQLPILTHFNRSEAGGTHFQLRSTKSSSKKMDHIMGCCFKDSRGFFNRASHQFDHIEVNNKGIARLNILNPIKLKSKKKNRFQQDCEGESRKYQSFGALQEIYNRYNKAWEELSVITEDEENLNIKSLLVSSSKATNAGNNYQNQIKIVIGVIEKVEARNKGGFINIIFKREQGQSSYPFQLSVSPYHIYKEDDLSCLVGRKIGCYGRLNYNKNFAQMNLSSLHRQIVYFDLQEGEACPFTIPSIDFSRVNSIVTNTLANYQALPFTSNIEEFSYYLDHQRDIQSLEKQIEQGIKEKESLLKEKEHKTKIKTELVVEREQLNIKIIDKKKELGIIESQLKKEEDSLKSFILKKLKRSQSKNFQELTSKREIIQEEICNIRQEFYRKSNQVIEHEELIQSIPSRITNIEKHLSITFQTIENLKEGLKIEKTWREVLKKENCCMYHISSINLWVAVQVSRALYNSSKLEFECFFQQYYGDQRTRVYPKEIQSIKFSIPPNELMIYQKIKSRLIYKLDNLSYLRKIKL
ncbi:hypothetical protein [Priestia aryabhattai]|uniref:hypothetical protein n=1 Tax=Priestia aryabhattai TaxID=412384 RepID=UPI0027E5002D|nr:hypothetical protein [Priestia aryabhattai]MCG0050252.1 hypothetical protein [Priestia aryabhattai]